MEIFRFLQRETKALDRRLFILVVFAGILNLLIVSNLTTAASKVAQHESDLWELAKVVVALWAVWLIQGLLLRRINVIVEDIVEKVRQRIVNKIRNSELTSIEHIGRTPPYNAVSTHATTISRATYGIFSALSSLVFLCLAFFIILYISVIAFLIVAGSLAGVLLVLKANHARVGAHLNEAVSQDNRFVDAFGDSIDGFKELKINSAKAHEFFTNHLEPLARKAKDLRVEAGLVITRTAVLMNTSVFMVLAALIFLLPVLSPAEASKLTMLSIFVVFIFGPINQVVQVYPLFNDAVASIKEVQRVERQLDSAHDPGLADTMALVNAMPDFATLQCTGLAFRYLDEHGRPSFSLEPLTFRLSKGDLVFITGGNGSGKSTFLKVLAGLYLPALGSIAVNGVLVVPSNRQSYRNLFSPIFSDVHLFDFVYGVETVEPSLLRGLLEMAELSHKVSIVDRQVISEGLSTGQRKRLALVLALLEDKPILLLDEWAAEQDPPFRRKFYREILPWLKQQNKTIVAVTHDDDHYDVADRVLKMRTGRFV